MSHKKVLSALVRNHPGVLQRVSGLFYRRGYNIETISACATENPKFTRITLVVLTNDELEMSQIIRQLSKIQDVRRIAILDSGRSICAELMMVKFRVEPERRTEFLNLTCRNHMNVVYIGDFSAIVTASGSTDDLDETLSKFSDYPIIEQTRTGISAMEASDRPFVEMDDAEFIN
ncbi:MAG: acetolactate synthase small subunit [Clostridia bacterium]|jgi:acetolactate synthase-1/3 small subunit|nr:acetolactate synthase small subunit [Clostridia bacterium]